MNDLNIESILLTAAQTILKKYNHSDKFLKNQPILLKVNDNFYLTEDQTLEFFELAERKIAKKDLEFRRKSHKLGNDILEAEIKFSKIKGAGNRTIFSLNDLKKFIKKLYTNSIDLYYRDAQEVIKRYDHVLSLSKKYGMRGQRNFTGKIEDEIRGKLAEYGFSQYINQLMSVKLPIDYSSILDDKKNKNKRDKGDFQEFIINEKNYRLPFQYLISLKSTNGNYLAIPEEEMEWEGDIFILVKLHIKETFLYKAIKAGLQLETIDLNAKLGWLEMRGYIYKADFLQGYKSTELPDGTKLSKINLIKAPNQLNSNFSHFQEIFTKIAQEIDHYSPN